MCTFQKKQCKQKQQNDWAGAVSAHQNLIYWVKVFKNPLVMQKTYESLGSEHLKFPFIELQFKIVTLK